MNEEKCPCCHNHCDKSSLSCERGRNYFEGKSDNETPKTIDEIVIYDLRKCGHLLHHNKELNSNDILKIFSLEELNQLHDLLSKVYNNID